MRKIHMEKSQDDLFQSAVQMKDAHNYNDWVFSKFQKFLRGRVLEVGCGIGTFTERIIKNGGYDEIVAIDISKHAIVFCKNRFRSPSITFRNINVSNMRGTYDLIICMNVLEHIENDQVIFEKMIGMLKPKGILFLLVPAHKKLFNQFDEDAGHFKRYDKKTIESMMDQMNAPRFVSTDKYYFNIAGAIGYWFVYKVIKKKPNQAAKSEINIFERIVVPLMRVIERPWLPFGISLITIFEMEK